ncbi:MAG: hypothetical protein KatS3mg081_1653 [Gemmatimonadales bacterium]|nr:MAG: hypothetical protein KatS3mg081_1653 [Gemmatimonadales bacterium]
MIHNNPSLVLAGALAAAIATPLASQQQSSNSARANRPPAEAVAVRAQPRPPEVDGRLDDEAWRLAPVITGFTQRDPHEGMPATEPTEARVVYTDRAIYVAIRAYDSQPDRITGLLTRRDQWSPSDWLGVAFDSYRDRRTAFAFMVNPAGVKRDIYFFNDGDGEDDSWDPVWDVAVSRDSLGWSAEFRIPFSQLRFPKGENHRFGFNLYRMISRLNEEQFWQLPPKNEPGFVSRFGDLVGIVGIQPPRRIELLPYSAAGNTWEPAEAGNPFRTGTKSSARVGADLNVGITPNLTLSATINPDFGQVEADPAVVNLTAFETFFPEKRPFFNEGLDIFRFPISLGDGDGANEQLFYTRRIGRAPQGRPDPRGGFAEAVPQTTILGAAKLSGKTSSGWNIGALGALTAEEKASVIDGAGRRHEDVVEPLTGYFVGRLARDFRNGLTQIGLFATAVERDLPPELNYLRQDAYSLGASWNHRFWNDTYAVAGWIAGSRVSGSPEAIDRTQRSSARYFQRPDNDYVAYDPSRTALAGFAGQLMFMRTQGNWRYGAALDTRSPGFEVNDLGFQREADRTIQAAWINRRWLKPGKVFRSFNLNFNQWSLWNYGWDRLGLGGNVNANWTWLNYWGGYLGVERNSGGLDPAALRGGPGFIGPGRVNFWSGLWSDQRKTVRARVDWGFTRQDEGAGWSYRVGPGISWRPAENVDLSASPSFSRVFNGWQYLRRADALGETHYLFGELDQTTVSMTFRANLTFTPNLSLQVYAQPFVASGDYKAFKRVVDPRAPTFAGRFDRFGPDRLQLSGDTVRVDLDRDGTPDLNLGTPDFTVLSLRSNVVLRWEYLPGSTLFLVWQHGRAHSLTDGSFSLGPRLDDLFSAPATNTLLVKINYWLSL